MFETRDNHCQCACHYFPKMIQHNDNPCCEPEMFFVMKDVNTYDESEEIEDDFDFDDGFEFKNY